MLQEVLSNENNFALRGRKASLKDVRPLLKEILPFKFLKIITIRHIEEM